MDKMQDLRSVFGSVATESLELLRNAINNDRAIRGRFIDARGNGCLVYWASGREVVDRRGREQWEKEQALLGCDADAVRRVIAGWDAISPSGIVKGPGYDEVYPKPTYTVMTEDVLSVIDELMAARREANAEEDAAVAKCGAEAVG